MTQPHSSTDDANVLTTIPVTWINSYGTDDHGWRTSYVNRGNEQIEIETRGTERYLGYRRLPEARVTDITDKANVLAVPSHLKLELLAIAYLEKKPLASVNEVAA